MFYCKSCAEEHDYPESIRVSFGPCEICGTNGDCYDVPSSHLPRPKTKIDLCPKCEKPLIVDLDNLDPKTQCLCNVTTEQQEVNGRRFNVITIKIGN